MKDLLLVHLPDIPLDGSSRVYTPPLGLWSMRTNNAGVRVKVIDAGVSNLPECSVDAVGYSLLFPSHEKHLPAARKCIHAMQEFVGGPTGGRLRLDNVAAFVGPEDFLAGRPVPFADLQPPMFSAGEMEPYWQRGMPFSGLPSRERWMPVETSRGCPNACGFCAIPALWGHWQSRPLAVLDEYFAYLKARHGVTEIIVLDDNVAAQVGRFLQIIELFKKHDLAWSVANGLYNRALLNEEVLEAIKGSRCLYLSLPFEAGNKRSAALMNLGKKYLTFSEAMWLTRRLAELSVHTAGQFIIGYPGESEAEVRETLLYANALALSQRHIHIATPLAGTPMYEICIKNGYLAENIENATYKIPIIETPMLSRKRLYTLWCYDQEAARRRKA